MNSGSSRALAPPPPARPPLLREKVGNPGGSGTEVILKIRVRV